MGWAKEGGYVAMHTLHNMLYGDDVPHWSEPLGFTKCCRYEGNDPRFTVARPGTFQIAADIRVCVRTTSCNMTVTPEEVVYAKTMSATITSAERERGKTPKHHRGGVKTSLLYKLNGAFSLSHSLWRQTANIPVRVVNMLDAYQPESNRQKNFIYCVLMLVFLLHLSS